MNTIFEKEYEDFFEGSIRQIEYGLTHATALFVESTLNDYMSESSGNSLMDSIREFFARMVEVINTYARDLQARIEDTVRRKEIYRKLKDLHNELKENKAAGAKTVQVMDVWKYESTYLRMNKDLWKIAKKFAGTKYTKTADIEADLRLFDHTVDTYAEQIKEITEHTIEIRIDKMINFVEDELHGKSKVIATLNESMTKFREMERDAINLKNRYKILGVDVIPHHVNFIKKMVRKITDFIHKCVVKFVTTVVFLFA